MWDTMGRPQEGPQPLLMAFPMLLNVLGIVRTADHRKQHDYQDIHQLTTLPRN